MPPRAVNARIRLLEAARDVIRAKGFAATTVDDLCRQAGVTKGAFFHHFKSKEELGVAAADFWSETTSALFAAAPYHQPDDPFDRLIAYLQFRKELLAGDLAEFTCLVGTMAQEVFDSAPAIREACHASISGHAMTLVPDIRAAMDARGVSGFTPESLALHTQAVLQGAFILAKAGNSVTLAQDSVDHLIRYVSMVFSQAGKEKK
ncbi:TetR family transcriptional regulator [Hoeflea sp. BAL378]|uniref:TetR/AcrR family transcriptional regulator n=1 Tax=Hoeflea sp. BAL378 TaxID=1547437 RepID=UPI0005132009|nr:TetR/AcrR family transcriptional regulator [Hoeflea sp. BAL378]KGF69190.1 TetR family transcriptional regulator [Hoeflea sp. BAL378]